MDLRLTCKKKELDKMKVKVIDLLGQAKQHEVVTNNLEKEVEELQELLSVREKSHLHDSPSRVDDRHMQRPDVNNKHVPEEQNGENKKVTCSLE